jgi:hypothetical protein
MTVQSDVPENRCFILPPSMQTKTSIFRTHPKQLASHAVWTVNLETVPAMLLHAVHGGVDMI